jgi:hypothetical protein
MAARARRIYSAMMNDDDGFEGLPDSIGCLDISGHVPVVGLRTGNAAVESVNDNCCGHGLAESYAYCRNQGVVISHQGHWRSDKVERNLARILGHLTLESAEGFHARPGPKTTGTVDYGLNISADQYVDEGIPLIRTSDFDDYGNLSLRDTKFVDPPEAATKLLQRSHSDVEMDKDAERLWIATSR